MEQRSTCKTCRFWHEDEEKSRLYSGGVNDGIVVGQCRRYAPRSATPEPTTAAHYWCGEHQWAPVPKPDYPGHEPPPRSLVRLR